MTRQCTVVVSACRRRSRLDTQHRWWCTSTQRRCTAYTTSLPPTTTCGSRDAGVATRPRTVPGGGGGVEAATALTFLCLVVPIVIATEPIEAT